MKNKSDKYFPRIYFIYNSNANTIFYSGNQNIYITKLEYFLALYPQIKPISH